MCCHTVLVSHFRSFLCYADTVFITEDADTHFSSISPVRRLADGLSLYKIFSKKHLHKHVLKHMFLNHTQVSRDLLACSCTMRC